MTEHVHRFRPVFARWSAPTPYAGDACQCGAGRLRLFLDRGDIGTPAKIPKGFAASVGRLLWGKLDGETRAVERVPLILKADGTPAT